MRWRKANTSHNEPWLLGAWPQLARTPSGTLAQRPPLVPALWSGSAQHFYHFLLGYLFPAVLWQDAHQASALTVRDCGPMNRWWSLFDGVTDLEVIASGQALQRIIRNEQAHVELAPLDDPATFRSDLLAQLRAWGERVSGSAPAERIGVVLVDRGREDGFYATEASEIAGSAAGRRSLPNAGQLASDVGATLVDLDACDPADQIRIVAGTSCLVAQHGAALAHMVWMRPGGTVVEIQPPQPTTEAAMFRQLAQACGLRYAVVPQSDDHAPVESRLLTDALRLD